MPATKARVETTFLDVEGKKTQLTRGGEGPPLVYLHSASGETDWTEFHDLLAERFTVYVPAHPGFALSDGLDKVLDITDLAWHYADLFDQLELARVPVVGFSLGAWVGVELAILRPGLVGRLVLTAAAGLHVPGAPMAELFIDDWNRLRELVFLDPASAAAEAAMPAAPDEGQLLMWLRAREATARVGWNPYLHNPRLADHLRRVECPTLVLWGRQDRLIPLAHGEEYARRIPKARLEVFESCGHMVPFEKPAEWAARVVAWSQG
jgi:pimeloyl-ACP methyl ester carboxylesterase